MERLTARNGGGVVCRVCKKPIPLGDTICGPCKATHPGED